MGEAYPKVGKDKDQLDARAKPFIEEAVQLYEGLMAVESEYGPEVNSYHYQCMIALADSTAAVKPGEAKKITSFDVAISASKRGGISIDREQDKIYQLERKKGRTKDEDAKLAEMKKSLPQRKKDIMKGVEEVLLRALELVQEGKAPKAKNKDIMEAHANLAWVLLTNGDLHRAVVIGEHAAHMPAADPLETKQAAQAAAWALQAYVHADLQGHEGRLSQGDDRIRPGALPPSGGLHGSQPGRTTRPPTAPAISSAARCLPTRISRVPRTCSAAFPTGTTRTA